MTAPADVSVPCRANCQLACPIDSWTGYVLDDLSDFRPGARLGFVMAWGRITVQEWPDAFAMVESVYGAAEVLDALRWLADKSLDRMWTDTHRLRAKALTDVYVRRAQRAAVAS